MFSLVPQIIQTTPGADFALERLGLPIEEHASAIEYAIRAQTRIWRPVKPEVTNLMWVHWRPSRHVNLMVGRGYVSRPTGDKSYLILSYAQSAGQAGAVPFTLDDYITMSSDMVKYIDELSKVES